MLTGQSDTARNTAAFQSIGELFNTRSEEVPVVCRRVACGYSHGDVVMAAEDGKASDVKVKIHQ